MSHTDSPLTCLENIIGFESGCTDIESTSGYYASQVGITKNFLSQIITKDYSSEEDFFRKKRSFAIDLVTKALQTNYADKYKAVSVIDSYRAGKWNENKVTVASIGKWKGILFDMCAEKSYLDFFLSELSMFVNYTGDVEVRVYDLMQGIVLDTVTVPCEVGEIVSVFPHKKFVSRQRKLQLFICYDATNIESYKTTLQGTCATCLPTYLVNNSYERIMSGTMAIGGTNIRSSIAQSNDTGGLSIVHSLQCNHSDWLCARSNQIADAVLYKLASLSFEFALDETPNSRTNTTVAENYDIIKGRYNRAEKKFGEAMDRFLNTVSPPNDDLCFNCRKSAAMVISIP